MRIIAFDLSLTATGVAMADDGVQVFRTFTLTPPKGMAGLDRLSWIRDSILDLVDPDTRSERPDLVVLEGYSYASAHQAHQLGELGGVIRMALRDAMVPHTDIQPGTLKRFATGKGNAKKEDMLAAAIRRLNYLGSNHNEADALWLYAAALEAHGYPLAQLPKDQVAALDVVSWPGLRKEAA